MGKVSVELLAVKELLAKNLNIPNYQRPYVWDEKQVLQLLDDIWENCCADKKEYRIGSVILHNNNKELDIVDGQQRITTLLIILTLLEERIVITDTNEVIDLTYTHTESQKHIRDNAITIDTWMAENADKKVFADFLKNKCKFVVITVEKLSEAFQMERNLKHTICLKLIISVPWRMTAKMRRFIAMCDGKEPLEIVCMMGMLI